VHGHADATMVILASGTLAIVCGKCTALPETQYAVQVGDFQRVRIPPGQSGARPEATRATKDQTVGVNKSSTRDTVINPPILTRAAILKNLQV